MQPRLNKDFFLELVEKGVYSLDELVEGHWWETIRDELQTEARHDRPTL